MGQEKADMGNLGGMVGQDVFMNQKKSPMPDRKGLEYGGEEDTLMGRLAKRMASRDMIDSLNLGTAKESPTATTADMGLPQRMSMGGAVKQGRKVEVKEHAKTISKIQNAKPGTMDKEKGAELIAKDHIDEMGKDYYDELFKMEDKMKGRGRHVQTIDVKAENSSDPIKEKGSKKGSTMREQGEHYE